MSHIRFFFSRFKRPSSDNEELSSSFRYFKLTPYEDVDCNSEPYRQLKYALCSKNDDIRNIAVSGDYGSGKSSLINSFIIKEKLEKTSICISLATFDLADSIKKSESYNIGEKKESLDRSGIEDSCTSDNSNYTVFSSFDNKNDNYNSYSDFVSNKIEESILKQLLYSTTVQKLNKSRFAHISKQSLFPLYIWVALFVCPFLDIFAFICTFKLCDRFLIFLEKEFSLSDIFYSFICDNYVLFIIIIISVVITFFSLKNVINLKKFVFSSSHFSIEVEKKSSFDAFLDEIVYFFEVTKFRYVFFEDLDRFNNIKIFNRLRELNFIINKNPLILKRVCFIYAIRNEIFFDAEQRLKFFDFVVSVIPYASQHSAYSYLLENKKQICQSLETINSLHSLKNNNTSSLDSSKLYFESKILSISRNKIHDNKLDKSYLYARLLNKIDDEFFLEIGAFVKDSRLISNVFNEFFIFCDMFFHYLDSSDLDKVVNDYDELFSRKLFSFALLKNLYPNEFRQFTYSENSKFKIIDVFLSKEDYLSQIKEVFLDKLKFFKNKIDVDLTKILESDDNYALRKVKESWLTSILGNNWYELFFENNEISFNGGISFLSFKSIFSYDFSPDLSWEDSNIVFQKGYHKERSVFVVKNVKNIVDLIESIKNRQLTRIKEQIALLQKYLSKFEESFLLKDLLDLCYKAQLFYDRKIEEILSEIKLDIKNKVNNDFIFYLIKNGYIAEDYSHFLSRNSNVTVSSSDQSFIRSMIMNDPLDYSWHLHRIKNILNQVSVDSFGCVSSLNYELFDYLLLNEKKYISKLKKFISSFEKFGEDGVLFLYNFCFVFKKINKIGNSSIQPIFNVFIKYNPMYWKFCYDSIQFYSEGVKQNELEEFSKFKIEFIETFLNYSFLQDGNKKNPFESLNENNSLIDTLCNDPYFLKSIHLLEPKILSSIFEKFPSKVNSLPAYNDVDDKYHCFFDYILKNNRFSMNKNVLETLAANITNGDERSSKSILTVFYSSRLNKDGDGSLFNYLSNNIESLIQELFLKNDNSFQQDLPFVCGEVIKGVLSNNKVQDKELLLTSFIERENFIIDDIALFLENYISSEQWQSVVVDLLVKHNRIKALWLNAAYLKDFDIKLFSIYLENNFSILSVLDKGYILNCNNLLSKLELSTKAFASLVNYLYDPNENISTDVIDALPESKLSNLVLFLNIHNNANLLKGILSRSFDLSFKYLHNNKHLITDNNSMLYQIDISEEIIEMFLSSKSIISSLKADFINNLFAYHKLPIRFYNIISVNRFPSLNSSVLEAVFSSLSDIPTIRKFVYLYHNSMDLKLLVNCLRAGKNANFNAMLYVFEKKQTRTIKNSKTNLNLLKRLINLGAIDSFEISNDSNMITCFPV